MYDDPEVFKPERFEKSDVQDPRGIVFGFGRRYLYVSYSFDELQAQHISEFVPGSTLRIPHYSLSMPIFWLLST